MNPLVHLLDVGQSYWLDNLTRKMITSGELKQRVEKEGLRGVTSNPSIFNKAITNSRDYDAQIASLVKGHKSATQIYDALTLQDVRDACDVLRPVYDQSTIGDGFISLEVSPFLARDTAGTMIEARRLFGEVGRPNCYIKIPGTREGLPAIEQMLYEGININITLLFSVDRYVEVAQAYIRSMQRRVEEGKPIDSVFSVASVFLSRIDLLVDSLLAQRVIPAEGINPKIAPEKLFGQAGIATAQLAYQRFKTIFSGPSWKKLEEQGAQVQRPLWASTSNKDPLYHDLRYVEPLIGSRTINTLPDETIAAFADHGVVKQNAIEQDPGQAEDIFTHLGEVTIDLSKVTQQLEDEGIQKFTASYTSLIGNIAAKRLEILGMKASPQQISCGKMESELKAIYASLDEKQTANLLFAKNPYLWNKPPDQMKEISQRMGWLFLPEYELENVPYLISFASQVKSEGYTHAVLLGMGGSSLCSEVARETFGTASGYLQLLVLDDTNPSAIKALEEKIRLDTTLFIVASKSGNTAETLSFFYYFYDQVKKKTISDAGSHFVAITDDGTPLVKLADSYHFRKIFINPSDLGGRYSVLSDFGLVPMALMGIDIKAFISSAREMQDHCASVPSSFSPGLSLGAFLGLCQRHGRDKVTFILSDSIQSFGFWVEQLLAESTGKEGRGLIPVHGEPLGPLAEYGDDRIFVHLYLDTDDHEADDLKLKALEEAGHPILRIQLPNRLALGGEYYRWEVATAVAGIIMDINPFDQPNVEESKKNTNQLLEDWRKDGSFRKTTANLNFGAISIFAGLKSESLLHRQYDSVGTFVNAFVSQATPESYIAFLPYFSLTDSRLHFFDTWRQAIRKALKVATTCLNGPRYLHSTGQLHKGGPDTGLFILLTGSPQDELPIPGSDYGFSVLHQAQALGDFRSLEDKGRRVIRIQMSQNLDEGLKALNQSVMESLQSNGFHTIS